MTEPLPPLISQKDPTRGRRVHWRQVFVLLAGLVVLGISLLAFWDSLGWWVRMITPFRFQYLGGGILLLAASFLTQCRWPTRLVSAAAIVANLVVLWPWVLPHRDAAPDRSFLLMSWNTWIEHPDLDQIVRAVIDSGADVALLCETPPSWRDGAAPIIEGYQTFSYNQYVLAVKEGGAIKLESSGFSRPIWDLEAQATFQDRPLRLLNAHTGRPTSEAGCQFQDRHDRLLEKWLHSSPLPAIITGDFNQTPWCPTLARTIAKLGLMDASRGSGFSPTFPAEPTVLGWLVGVPIDQCLYTPELTCRRRWVGSANGSNHRPVLAEMGWRDSPGK